MTELRDIYDIAEDKSINVYCFHLDGVEACSVVSKEGNIAVAIDPILLRSEIEEKLIHEVAHCVTGAFYSERDDWIVRAKCAPSARRVPIAGPWSK